MPDRLDEPLSRSELARQAGISATTLANWRDRLCEHPLQTLKDDDAGTESFTWRLLLDFCRSNPSLPKIRQVNEYYRRLFDSTESVSDPRLVTDPLGGDGLLEGAEPSAVDVGTLRVSLQDLKGAVDESAALVAAATKLAEDVGRAHQDITAQLELAIQACGISAP